MKKILLLSLFVSNSLNAGVIADTIYLEARGEGENGMRAVATVIYNRAKGKIEDMVSVCLKPKQFSCWNSSKNVKIAPKNFLDRRAYKICNSIEKELLNGNFKPLGSWTHYHVFSITPYWNKSRKGTKIGNHLFLKTK